MIPRIGYIGGIVAASHRSDRRQGRALTPDSACYCVVRPDSVCLFVIAVPSWDRRLLKASL